MLSTQHPLQERANNTFHRSSHHSVQNRSKEEREEKNSLAAEATGVKDETSPVPPLILCSFARAPSPARISSRLLGGVGVGMEELWCRGVDQTRVREVGWWSEKEIGIG